MMIDFLLSFILASLASVDIVIIDLSLFLWHFSSICLSWLVFFPSYWLLQLQLILLWLIYLCFFGILAQFVYYDWFSFLHTGFFSFGWYCYDWFIFAVCSRSDLGALLSNWVYVQSFGCSNDINIVGSDDATSSSCLMWPNLIVIWGGLP